MRVSDLQQKKNILCSLSQSRKEIYVNYVLRREDFMSDKIDWVIIMTLCISSNQFS